MEFGSRHARQPVQNFFILLVPEFLLCLIVSFFCQGGFIGAFLGLIGFEILCGVITLIRAIVSWLLFKIYWKDQLVKEFAEYYRDMHYPNPSNYSSSPESFFIAIAEDEELKPGQRIIAAIDSTIFSCYRQNQYFQKTMLMSSALEDALKIYQNNFSEVSGSFDYEDLLSGTLKNLSLVGFESRISQRKLIRFTERFLPEIIIAFVITLISQQQIWLFFALVFGFELFVIILALIRNVYIKVLFNIFEKNQSVDNVFYLLKEMQYPSPGNYQESPESFFRKVAINSKANIKTRIDASVTISMMSWMRSNGLAPKANLMTIIFEDALDKYSRTMPKNEGEGLNV